MITEQTIFYIILVIMLLMLIHASYIFKKNIDRELEISGEILKENIKKLLEEPIKTNN